RVAAQASARSPGLLPLLCGQCEWNGEADPKADGGLRYICRRTRRRASTFPCREAARQRKQACPPKLRCASHPRGSLAAKAAIQRSGPLYGVFRAPPKLNENSEGWGSRKGPVKDRTALF